jgi:hypothetical protein
MKKTLLEQLRAEIMGEPPPDGWYTLWQLMELLGSKRTATQNMAQRKKWQTKKFRTLTRDGKEVIAVHYYLGKL